MAQFKSKANPDRAETVEIRDSFVAGRGRDITDVEMAAELLSRD